jgi:hypothetical protein
MFGYVQPYKPELKMKEYDAFQGYYCGLCKAIRDKYTHAARFMLNYDCAVLSLLLSSLSDEMPGVCRERCIASPLKKKTVVHASPAEYAATVNVLLGWGKLKDSVRDEKKLSARALLILYWRVFRRARRDNAQLTAVFDERLDALHQLEMQKSDSVDAVASEFAHLLAAVFSSAPHTAPQQKKPLWHFGYNLGRWIYIADAVDDIDKDNKSGAYNVFLQRGCADIAALKKKIQEEAAFNLNISLAEACKAYELLDIKRDKPLLDNIMYLGLAKKTEDILQGPCREKSRRGDRKGELHGSV